MAINYVPLDKNKHKSIKIAVKNDFSYAKGTHIAAASIKEFAQLGSSIPLVFIQDPNTQRHHVVAMLGMEANQNLFVNENGWQAPHVPLNVLRYPFDVRPENGTDKLTVFIDENCDMLGDEGTELFDENGEPSEYLQNRQKFLGDLANSEMSTQQFVKKMVEFDLLDPINIVCIHKDGTQRNVTGIMSINERKLIELSDEKVLELHRSGFLGAAYSMMLSLGQLSRLIELSKDLENPIVNMRMAAAQPAQAEAANA